MEQKISYKRLLFFTALVIVATITLGCTVEQQQSFEENFGINGSDSGEGRIVFSVTDAAADMGSVSEVRMTVDGVRAQSETQGWIQLSSEEKTYNLLELRQQNRAEVLTDVTVSEDNFTQIRFDIKEVIVVDNQGEHQAKVPSENYKISLNTRVKNNETSFVELDVLADESLHITGNGKYIMAPVLKVESRNDADVRVASDGSVSVNGGVLAESKKIGMDINGKVGVGLNIPSNQTLEIKTGGPLDIDGKIGIVGSSSGNESSITNNGSGGLGLNGSARTGLY